MERALVRRLCRVRARAAASTTRREPRRVASIRGDGARRRGAKADTAAVIVAGKLRGVPVALHEANRVPGKAIRTLSRFARRVYLPPGVTIL